MIIHFPYNNNVTKIVKWIHILIKHFIAIHRNMYSVMKIVHSLLIYNQQYKILNHALFSVKKINFTNCNYNKM